MKQRIAITGSGIICAIGTDKKTVSDALVARKSGIQGMKYLPSCHKDLLVGEVKQSDEELKMSLGIRADKIVSRTVLLGAYAVRQALDDAGLKLPYLKTRRVCFISGTTVGGMDVTERFYHSILADDTYLDYLDAFDCGKSSVDIAELAGLDADTCTVSTACSSALNAIILGTRMLLAGEADLIVAGGAESLSLFHLNGFKSLMILSSEPCRPFDASRSGLNLGEGAAYVVLERFEDAVARHAEVSAFIAGYGNRCDAFHQTATSENGEGAYLAMQDALCMAGIDYTQVDYINAHGTGTLNNDQSESVALKRLFDRNIPPVSSTKSFTGHTTSASGAIETVISLIAMRNHYIPVNLGWQTADANCIVPFMGNGQCRLQYVLCNSFGFGGNDTSLLLSQQESELPLSDSKVEAEILSGYELKDLDELKLLKQFIPPIEQRRMDLLTKAAMYTSLKVLSEAGIHSPDAIIVATSHGMLTNSEKILRGIDTLGEDSVSPTLFMQSTHNTLAGILAVRLKCHGYNMTYVQGEDSLRWAIADARMLITEGKAKVVLVGCHDECTGQYASFLKRAGKKELPCISSKSLVIVKKDNK